jgi:hypothetical protein
VALNTKNQIKSNHINKRKRMPKGKSNIDNPEKLATQVKDEEKQSKRNKLHRHVLEIDSCIRER